MKNIGIKSSYKTRHQPGCTSFTALLVIASLTQLNCPLSCNEFVFKKSVFRIVLSMVVAWAGNSDTVNAP